MPRAGWTPRRSSQPQGEVCSAGSRLLLEERIYEKFLEGLVERAQKIVVGDGTHPETEMGPLISEGHMERVLDYIRIGLDEGAQLLCGGKRITSQGLEKGYFVEPTIFAADRNDLRSGPQRPAHRSGGDIRPCPGCAKVPHRAGSGPAGEQY